MQSTATEPAAAWEQIAPLLDEAMGHLGETDRNAVVLRFFENKTASEIAAALNLNEAAAHKRVARGLEKLRKYFAKRGIALTAAAIAGTVAVNSVQAAPAGVAVTAAATVAKGAVVSGSTLTLVKGALKIMVWIKVKTVVVVTVGLVLTTSVSVIVVEKISQPGLIQGKTESEWINSIVYRGDDDQTRRWHALGPRGIQMLVRALKPPANKEAETQRNIGRKTRMDAANLLCELANYYTQSIIDAKGAIPRLIESLKTETDGGVLGNELACFEGPIKMMGEKDKAALFPELVRAMQSRETSVRINALVALQYYPGQTDSVVPLMVKSLQDFNPQVRVTAVKALNQFDPQNAAAADFVQILIGCITGPAGDTPGVANDAVIELGELHRDPDLAVPALMQTLRSDDIYIRENSAAALGKFGNQAKPVVNALHKALEDPDANVRQQAAMALKRID